MGKKQPLRRDSIAEISLPLDWQASTIGDEVEFTRKPRGLVMVDGQAVPFIPMDLLPNDGLYTSQFNYRNGSDLTSGVFFNEGDLLLAKITPCLENGKQAIVTGIPGGWGFATTEVFPIRPTRMATDFLAFYLRNSIVRQELAGKMQGATGRQRLPREVLEGFPIPVPPLPEQKAIAEVLRTVQQAKEATEKVIAACRQLKKSLMQHLFTYGPVPFDQADKVALKETEIGPVPEHWEVKPLRECALLLMGSSPPGHTYNTTGNGLPLINGPAEYGPRHPCAAKWTTAPTRLCKAGDVLVCVRGNTTGRLNVADREYCIGRGVAAFQARPGISTPKYISFLAERIQSNILAMATGGGSTFPNINKPQIEAMVVPLPPICEQTDLSSFLELVNGKILAEESRRSALIVLFNTLLHNLMTGKVRVV